MHSPLVFIISGPSGAGKGTIVKKILNDFSDLQHSVSCTTRPPRPGEKEGKDYFFIDKKIFKDMIKYKKFLEYAKVYKDYYGTTKEEIMKILKMKKDIIMELDVQGALKIKKMKNKLKIYPVLIFIKPSSNKELFIRLRKRGTESAEFIRNRLKASKKELNYIKNYDYLVFNDKLDKAYSQIKSIIEAERSKIRKERIKI